MRTPQSRSRVTGRGRTSLRSSSEKRRTPWRFADAAGPLVVVDETPLGLFAEIEGEADAVRALGLRRFQRAMLWRRLLDEG